MVHLRCMRMDDADLSGVFCPLEMHVFVNGREVVNPATGRTPVVAMPEHGHSRREVHHVDVTKVRDFHYLTLE